MTIEQAEGFLISGKWVMLVSAALMTLGVTGITPQDLQGTANVLSVLLGLIGFVATHIGHKTIAGAIKAGRIN